MGNLTEQLKYYLENATPNDIILDKEEMKKHEGFGLTPEEYFSLIIVDKDMCDE